MSRSTFKRTKTKENVLLILKQTFCLAHMENRKTSAKITLNRNEILKFMLHFIKNDDFVQFIRKISLKISVI